VLLAARNVLKAWILYGGFVALFTALGWWLGGLRLASVFFVVALLMAATLFWYGPRVVLASLRARELLIAEAPFVHTMLERLAARAGVVRPRMYVIEDGHPRTFAVGRGASASGIACEPPRGAGVDPGTFSFDVCGLDDGEVTLEGELDRRSEVEWAGRLAEQVPGVVAVHNRIMARYDDIAAAKA
jgi:hypothetical protein